MFIPYGERDSYYIFLLQYFNLYEVSTKFTVEQLEGTRICNPRKTLLFTAITLILLKSKSKPNIPIFARPMKEKEILKEYIPDKSVDMVMEWIVQKKVHFKITRSRNSKLGDYRPPINYPNHRISINHNLNPYSFLITFVHEMAHLNVWESHQNTVAPHGTEWKAEYRKLMTAVLKNNIFPDDIHGALSQSIINSKASNTSELQLSRVLKKYDKRTIGTNLEDLPENTIFQTENGSRFKKGAKRRTRYLCQNMHNNKQYLFHPLTSVEDVGIEGD